MRRLALALLVVGLVLGATSAAAAKSGPALKVTGSAHVKGGKVRGSFMVKNVGATEVPAFTASVLLAGRPLHHRPIDKWIVQRASIHALAPGAKQRVAIRKAVPQGAKSAGSTSRSRISREWKIVVCAGRCASIGTFTVAGRGERQKATAPNAPIPTPAPAPTTGPLCPIPSAPIAYSTAEPFRHAGCGVEYWGYVPASYEPANPEPLLIWLHGCEGMSGGDIYTVSPGLSEEPQRWISLTLVGREEAGNECWVPSVDETKVMQALTDVETHLNVDPHQVFLGGYSSGGDLAYRTGFRHSSTFAGLLIENSSPFRDTESTQAESLAAATTKLHIADLAHQQDETYPIAGVQGEIHALQAAGFPAELIERPGTHYDEPGEVVEGNPVPGTDADLRTYLLPYLNAGWESP
jgi:dienelactone hydrolase